MKCWRRDMHRKIALSALRRGKLKFDCTPESQPAESINWLTLFVAGTAVGLRLSELRKA
jgi:hypothetical protein